ncbi:hypothetical protein ACVSQB_39010 [Bradyrhizobium elkanii]
MRWRTRTGVTLAAQTSRSELIEQARRFVEISCLLDAASEETLRLYQIGVDDTAAEEAFEDAMSQLRMITMRATTIEGMRATASAVLHLEWDGNVEFTEGAIEGGAIGVLVAGLLDKPLPDRLPD